MLGNRPGHHPLVLFVSAYMILMLCVGHIFSLGVLFPHIMDVFNTNRAKAAVVQSSANALFQIGGIFYGSFINRMGPQFVCVTGAFLTATGLMISFFATSLVYIIISMGKAMGISMQFMSCNVVVGKMFSGRKNAVALSVLSTATGVGALGYSVIMSYLLDKFGLRGTLLIMAGLELHGVSLAIMWPSPSRKETHKKRNSLVDVSTPQHNAKTSTPGQETCEGEGAHLFKEISGKCGNTKSVALPLLGDDVIESTVSKDGTSTSLYVDKPAQVDDIHVQQSKTDTAKSVQDGICGVLRNTSFLLFAIGIIPTLTVMHIILIIVADLVTDKGFGKSVSSSSVIVLNAFNIVGRLAPGLMMLIPKITTLSIPIIGSLIGSLSYFMLTFVTELPFLMVAICLSGATFGLLVTCTTVSALRLAGKDNFAAAWGVLLSAIGIMNAFAGPLTGYIRDQTNSYGTSLLIGAVTMLVGAGIFAVTQCLRTKQVRQSRVTGVLI